MGEGNECAWTETPNFVNLEKILADHRILANDQTIRDSCAVSPIQSSPWGSIYNATKMLLGEVERCQGNQPSNNVEQRYKSRLIKDATEFCHLHTGGDPITDVSTLPIMDEKPSVRRRTLH